MKPSSLISSAILVGAALAWPSYLEPAEILERGRHLLEPRQQSSTYNLGFTGDQGEITASSTTTSAGSSKTGGSTSTTSQSGSVTTGSTTTGSTTNKNTSKGSNAATRTTFDARSPPGGISMQTPNPFTATYFRIEDYITLGWNYTSCSVLPTAIDILAVASGANVQHTFTLAVNQSVSGSSQAFTWDSGNYQATATDKLLTASYTLVVHDADSDITAVPSAGYLATWNQFYFAMYSPQPSESFGGITCITCSGALSSIEKQAYGVVFGMMAMTVLSFTWFAGAAGVF